MNEKVRSANAVARVPMRAVHRERRSLRKSALGWKPRTFR